MRRGARRILPPLLLLLLCLLTLAAHRTHASEAPPTSAAASDAASAADDASALAHEAAQDELVTSALQRRRAAEDGDVRWLVGLLASAPSATVLVAPPAGAKARSMVMTAKSGKKFSCVVPDPKGPVESPSALPSPDGGAASSSSAPSASATSALLNLDPLVAAAREALLASAREAEAQLQQLLQQQAAATGKEFSEAAAPAAAAAAAPVPPAAPTSPASTPSASPAVPDSVSVPRLLRKHLGAGCFTLRVDWWTYEVCPFKRVRQYHRDGNSQAVTTEFSLGEYTAAADEVSLAPKEFHLPAASPGSPSPAASAAAAAAARNPAPSSALLYTQLYEGGSSNRRSLVRFLCNPDPSPAPNVRHVLVGVREPRTGQYEFDIRTTLMCGDAAERKRQGAMEGKGSNQAQRAQAQALAQAHAAQQQDAAATGGAGSTPTIASLRARAESLQALADKFDAGVRADAARARRSPLGTPGEQGRLNTGTRHLRAKAATSPSDPIPAVSDAAASSSSSSSSAASASYPSVLDLLEPLGNECLYLSTGWWSYKVCYLREVTQFHREQVANVVPVPPAPVAPTLDVKLGARSAEEAAANLAQAEAAHAAAQQAHAAAVRATMASNAAAGGGGVKMVTTAEYTLGRIAASAPPAALVSLTRIVPGETWAESYVAQSYTDGTLCDLNQKPRTTETRIYCDAGSTAGGEAGAQEGSADAEHSTLGSLRSVTEESTCQYVVVLHSPLLCAHPLFRPPTPKQREIACTPLSASPTAAEHAAGTAPADTLV